MPQLLATALTRQRQLPNLRWVACNAAWHLQARGDLGRSRDLAQQG
jgi:hypothetical protein